jgi:hypothetical protein
MITFVHYYYIKLQMYVFCFFLSRSCHVRGRPGAVVRAVSLSRQVVGLKQSLYIC